MSSELTTAHENWDAQWSDASKHARWSTPARQVEAVIPLLAERKAQRSADIGCGIGRHACRLAEAGLSVIATDGSAAGLAETKKQADDRGLTLDIHELPFDQVPVEDGSLDHLVSWNVIYHGDRNDVLTCLKEFRRALKPGGLLQLTMLSKRHRRFQEGREVAPDTWVVDGDGERDHAHYYCDALGLVTALGSGFEPLIIEDFVQDKPDTWHWHCLAEAI